MDKLNDLNPIFAAKIRTMIMSQEYSGLPYYDIFMGFRTFQEQDMLFALGRTVKNLDGACEEKPMGNIVTRARGGESWHNYGLAVDIVYRPNGQWSWDNKLPWNDLGKMGEGIGLEWGGRWKFKDLPHFQYLGKLTSTKLNPLTLAKSLYESGGIKAVWDAL